MNLLIRGLLFILCAFMVCSCGAGRRGKPEASPIVLGYSQLGDESTWRTQNSY